MSVDEGVKVGQVWQDADPRERGHRFVTITRLDAGFAYADVHRTDGKRHNATTRIRHDRFRDSIRGYRLVEEVEARPDA